MTSHKWRICLLMIIFYLFNLRAYPSVAQDINPSNILDDLLNESRNLRCGVHNDMLGGGFLHTPLSPDSPDYIGFDVDICRAVAVAITGNPNNVDFIPIVNPADRAIAIRDHQVDLLSRDTTLTFRRDVGADWDATFGPVVYYDRQAVMVLSDSNIFELRDLAGLTICVQGGTTTAGTTQQQFAGTTVILQSGYESNVSQLAALDAGQCDAITADAVDLNGLRARATFFDIYDVNYAQRRQDLAINMPEFRLSPDTGIAVERSRLRIIDDIDGVLGSEPLAPVSPADDQRFADLLRWVVFGLIQAEEFGINQENVNEVLQNSDDVAIQRFLGNGDANLGEALGLSPDFMYQVILQVGNYEDLYERNYGSGSMLNIPRGANQPRNIRGDLTNNTGLLYAPPFR